MEAQLHTLQKEAAKSFTTADHLVYVTLPLLKEDKLLLAITQNLHNALTKSVLALLTYEQLKKMIKEIPKDSQAQFELFESKIASKHKIPKETILVIKEVQEIMKKHEKSPVEFVRNRKYVVCDDKYRMKTLDQERVKHFIFLTRPLLTLVGDLPC